MSNWSNAGRVRPVSKGTWSSTVAYTVLDIVTSSDKLRSYIATQNVPAGTPLTNAAYWQVLVDATAINDTANPLMDRLASPFDKSGSVVTCHPVEGYSLKTKTLVEPAQSGSGDPSPSNIRPISGHTGAKLTRCGKNLLKLDSSANVTQNGVTFTVNSDGTIALSGTATNDIYRAIATNVNLANGEYILNGCPTGAVDLKYILYWAPEISSNKIDSGHGVQFTVDNQETYKVMVRIMKGMNTTGLVFKPMIRLATETDASYVPYQGETFSASFGQTVYGGTLDWNKGVLTVEWKKVSGRMTRSTTDSSGKLYVISGVPDSLKQQFNGFTEDDPYVICSALPYKALEYARPSIDPCISQYGASIFVGGYIGREAELDAILASDDFQIAYKLATPTTIQLTPAQILALKGTNNLYSDCGDTAVFGRIDPEWMNEQLKNAIIALGGNV